MRENAWRWMNTVLPTALALLVSCGRVSSEDPGPRGRSFWVRGPAGRLHVRDEGRGGLPVVLVHGLSGNLSQWGAQLEHLRSRRRVVALDLRGMGNSDASVEGAYSPEDFAADVAAVVDTLKLQRFVLVGHSYGGAVIAGYAGAHPERAAGLLFVDATGDVRSMTSSDLEQIREGFKAANYEAFLDEWFEGILVNSRAEVRKEVMRSLRATERDVFVRAFEALLTFDPGSALARYSGPRLSVVAESMEGPYQLHVTVPGVPHVVVGGVSHWLMMDRPEEFNGGWTRSWRRSTSS